MSNLLDKLNKILQHPSKDAYQTLALIRNALRAAEFEKNKKNTETSSDAKPVKCIIKILQGGNVIGTAETITLNEERQVIFSESPGPIISLTGSLQGVKFSKTPKNKYTSHFQFDVTILDSSIGEKTVETKIINCLHAGSFWNECPDPSKPVKFTAGSISSSILENREEKVQKILDTLVDLGTDTDEDEVDCWLCDHHPDEPTHDDEDNECPIGAAMRLLED